VIFTYNQNMTDFNQINIYNQFFKDAKPPALTPSKCINEKLSYYSIFNGKRLPVMIGSVLHIHKDDNPLQISGYFIIDGQCKSVSSMYVYDRVLYTTDRAYITSGRVSILAMGKYEQHIKGKKSNWYLPINYDEIYKYSTDSKRLKSHLDLVASHTDYDQFTSKITESDAYILCQMFEYYIGIKKNYVPNKRLITAGELIYDALNLNQDVIKYFRTHAWTVKNIQNVNSVSEDMKHYSMIGDIEAIRRVTFPTVREITRMKDRYINDYEKNIFCPVQTSDGVLCGTIMYLCIGATVTLQGSFEIVPGNKYMFFENGIYKQHCDDVNVSNNTTIIRDDHSIMIWTSYGRILPGESIISYAVNYIPYRTYNPAIRSMFTASMIKQAITMDSRVKDGMFNDTKYLIQGEQPLKGLEFPHPAGWNLIVAIMPYYGYNVEDAIVISESVSLKYMTEKYSVYSTQLKSKYDKITECKIKEGDYINKHDVLFRAYHPTDVTTIEIVRSLHEGQVTKIINSENCFSVKISNQKPLEVGDKMSSRHGQKGVVSLIVPDRNMPRYLDDNNEWKTIELIINPHAFPTRKTMGQIKEMGETLRKVENIKSEIYVGPCYYMALRHQVADKVQFRNIGANDDINKQAITGKSRTGGLRFGHMERDILLSVGAHSELESIYSIDKTDISCCDTCGLIGMASQLSICSHERYNVSSHQYVIICTSLLRANGHDIRYYPKSKEYEIIDFKIDDTPRINNADDLHFGYTNLLDIRHFVSGDVNIPIIPAILRTTYLDNLYKRIFNKSKNTDIFKELRKMLMSKKNGFYHNLVEGHRVNHCVRSVIVPNPDIPEDVVELPFGCDIGKSFGLLNRQPSLSEQSMMSVKLIIGKKKTIGIHPRLCKSFNADFDGDEMCIFGMDSLTDKLPIRCNDTQDYIHSDNLHEFTHKGLTCDKAGIMKMIQSGAKGSLTDFQHIYVRIGDVIVNGEIEGVINNCYNNGLTEDEWYLQSKAGREGASSIGINTPFIGDLNSYCNRMMI
jgi:RNA polymerase Rpb2, domain 6/RNA polymerase Rpb1, domain 2/RNA polymerase Rpb2, domain 3